MKQLFSCFLPETGNFQVMGCAERQDLMTEDV